MVTPLVNVFSIIFQLMAVLVAFNVRFSEILLDFVSLVIELKSSF